MPTITTNFLFGRESPQLPSQDAAASSQMVTMIIGKKSVLLQGQELEKLLFKDFAGGDYTTEELLSALIEQTKVGNVGTTFVSSKHMIAVAILPETTSRNLHSYSVHIIPKMIQSVSSIISPPTTTTTNVCRHLIYCGDHDTLMSSTGALVVATAKAFASTTYTRKTTSGIDDTNNSVRTVYVSFGSIPTTNVEATTEPSFTSLQVSSQQEQQWQAICRGIHLTTRLVDMPPNELTTRVYANECKQLAAELGPTVTYKEIVGEELHQQGYGGLYSVGQAATCPPRLVIMEYTPSLPHTDSDDSSGTGKVDVALVGKGIVYDTGGLSLKSKDGMPGMKMDMGGSAALLGAFTAAVQMNCTKRIVLILCLAENAIGPTAFRNDDIITMYSGKTVEINNTDAEGRLVLGDGVAHASRHYQPQLIVDMATLTGAQLVTTGKTHGAVLTNTDGMEYKLRQAGLYSGDVIMPLLYAPELLLSEFDSKVADMKNSVKDRGNAQSSCAGHFIETHLHANYHGDWVHVDMAGPAEKDGRATGYGVALVLALLEAPGF